MKRQLGFEAVEARRLLAADLEVLQQTFTSNSAEESSVTDAITANAIADIGSLDGNVTDRSRLSWWNPFDRIGFSLEREAAFSVSISNFRSNVDLFITDARGSLIGYSMNRGTQVDSFEATLESGQYYVWSFARSWRSTSYQMDLSAQLVPEPLPEPVDEPSVPRDEIDRLPDVPYFGGSNEWGLNAIGAPEAWAAGFTGDGITVAVIDTGVDLDHPDLAANIFVNAGEVAGNGIDDDGNGFVDDVNGYDFANNDPDPNDVHGHGTHVAGTIAALDNGFGAIGVAPDATLLPIKVLGDNGSGSSFDVAAGIRYAADMGADIINLSLGGGYSSTIESAISYARSVGSFVVAAAGNEFASVPGYPAQFSRSYDNVLSVGAHDSRGNIAAFSNAVGSSGAVQVDAPGVGVFSTYVGGGYASMSGTSMAAPHVAGLAALTLAADPTLTSAELREFLVAGVIGNASGSDAAGLASALYSVAYAEGNATSSGETAGSGEHHTSSGHAGSVGASSFSYVSVHEEADSSTEWDNDLVVGDDDAVNFKRDIDPVAEQNRSRVRHVASVDAALHDWSDDESDDSNILHELLIQVA
ncbi:MAG: S8 family peptidase [Planctomycetota bacterium]